MRLLHLSMTGIGPFRHRQPTVDFASLARSGLFLIEGPTGAGKSTIIDAIVFALYGTVAGEDSSKARIRSDLCQPDEPSEVILEFEIGGVPHRITRSPAYLRPKARGTGTTTEKARQLLEILDGSVPPMKDAVEIGSYITERLGLSAAHFRQLVVLPQGEFDALLRASPKERFDVLGSLIDDGFLAKVQQDLRERADTAIVEREAAAREADTLLEHLRERVREYDEHILPADDVMIDAAEITRLQDDLSVRVTTTRDDVTAREAEAVVARSTAALATQALSMAREAAQARDQLAVARRAVREFEPTWADSTAEELRGAAAELSAHRTRLEPWVAWEAGEDERLAEERRLAEAVAAAAAHVQTIREQGTTLPARRADADEAVATATLAAAGLDSAQAEVTRIESLVAAAAELQTARNTLAEARADESRAAAALEERRKALHVARTAAGQALRTQLDQRAAHLARQLAQGQPCPVCGATEHPHPADASHGDVVTDDDVAELEAKVAELDQAEQLAAAAHVAAQEKVQIATGDVAGPEARLGSIDPATLPEQHRGAREHCEAIARSAATLASAQQARSALAKEESELAERLEGAVAAESAALVQQRAAGDRVAAERAALRDQVGSDTTASALLAKLSDQAQAVERLLAALQRTAATEVARDVTAAQADDQQAQARLTEVEAALARAQTAYTRASETAGATTALVQRWHDAQSTAANVLARTAPVIELGDLVSARTTANVRRTTLQAYAVQRRFESVLEAASIHLERMSSGHYVFALETEASRGQAGLGIAVRDLWSGRDRDPATLSGGETFYASLSLALGLADVVREENGGVDLHTLFVDEGFGSLDQGALELVLDQLDALRARGRVVGVISHVTEMKEWVHDRLEVVPISPTEGSRIVPSDTPVA
jgi:exonuclease SbcC